MSMIILFILAALIPAIAFMIPYHKGGPKRKIKRRRLIIGGD